MYTGACALSSRGPTFHTECGPLCVSGFCLVSAIVPRANLPTRALGRCVERRDTETGISGHSGDMDYMFGRCGGGRGGGITAKMSETRRTFPNALLPMFEGINVTHVSGTDLLSEAPENSRRDPRPFR